MNREKAEKYLKIGLFGAVLTLLGDLLIGAEKFPDGANMIEGYFAIALAMPEWRPILGGLIGFAGICLEFFGLMTICPLIREKMPRGGRFFKLDQISSVLHAAGRGCIRSVFYRCECGAVFGFFQRTYAVSQMVLRIQSADW